MFLPFNEFASAVPITEAEALELAEAGRFPRPCRAPGFPPLYDEDAVEAWIAANVRLEASS